MRWQLFVAVSFALTGCVSSSSMNFGVVAVDPLSIPITMVREGVQGEDCASGVGKYESYELAMKLAIASAPGANALTNAKFSRVEVPVATMCVTVTGDAVRI